MEYDLKKVIQHAHKTLFIMCGLPYSGKSFLVNHIKEESHCKIVSIDDIFYRKGFDWTNAVLPDAATWNEIFEEAYTLTKEYLTQGENVLFDSTNHTLESREVLRSLASGVEADSFVVFIDVPEQVICTNLDQCVIDFIQ
jgi:predicted kinase